MNQFSSKQRQRERVVAQFMNFTQSNEKNAIYFLNQHDWKLDLAVDAYYLSFDSGPRRESSRSSSSSTVDRKKLDQLWNSYKGFCIFRKNIYFAKDNNETFEINTQESTNGSEEKMLSDNVCRFLQDLRFNLDERIVLVLAWRFKAQVQGEFTKDEFYNGMNELGQVFLFYTLNRFICFFMSFFFFFS